jgi:hypothetical protein
MKIALIGSAPSSMKLAPFGDPSWLIWGCSPGVYFQAPRVDAWFEVHRWEPPVIGKPDQQVPWFSPEYCMWMSMLKCPVWMLEHVPQIPNSTALPWQDLVRKYGHFFFNSSLSWMCAMAIEAIKLNRQLLAEGDARAIKSAEPDMIGFWGVDMAADEEQYTGQKAGCQFFATLAASLDIKVITPPESDLMIPRPLYGVSETMPRHIKLMARNKELMQRKAHAENNLHRMQMELHFVAGALDDMKYHLNTWVHEGQIEGPKFEEIFVPPAPPAAAPVETALGNALSPVST